MKTHLRYLLLITGLLISSFTAAQISAPGVKTVRYTSYPSSPSVRDQIFVYCNAPGSQSATLNASVPTGTPPYQFTWYKWDDGTKSFSNNIVNSIGVTSSVSGLDEGGYRVEVNGSIDTAFTAWIVFDSPPVASAGLQQKLCDRVALNGDTSATVHQFYYRDIQNGEYLSLKNEMTFMWSSQPETYIPAPDLFLDPVIRNFESQPNRTYRLPVENTTFTLTVNSLGCSSESSFFYEPIHAKADFSAEPLTGEAPLGVTFTDNSVRADNRYIWDFGEKNPDGTNKIWEVGEDSLWVFDYPFIHTYYRPGEYTVKLTVRSKDYCIDTFRLEAIIDVEESLLEIPNVFTPDGDSQNDFFVVESRSLRFLSIEIFSRSGLRVYRFIGQGETLASWKGWDGNVNETSVRASPGVYYYVIRALGWDDVEYDTKEQRGFVYLYR